MVISTRPSGAGAYTAIATDGASGGTDIIDWRSPVMTTLEQAVQGYGATNQVMINMGNALWKVGIPIRKFYASNLLARQAIATLGAQFNAGRLDVQVYDASIADATYFPACNVSNFTPDSADGQRGTAIYFTLNLTGPNYTTTPP